MGRSIAIGKGDDAISRMARINRASFERTCEIVDAAFKAWSRMEHVIMVGGSMLAETPCFRDAISKSEADELMRPF